MSFDDHGSGGPAAVGLYSDRKSGRLEADVNMNKYVHIHCQAAGRSVSNNSALMKHS